MPLDGLRIVFEGTEFLKNHIIKGVTMSLMVICVCICITPVIVLPLNSLV